MTLVAHWKMNDNEADTVISDATGNGHDATCVSDTETFSTTGKINQSLNFYDTAEMATVPLDESFTIYNTPVIAISGWIYYESIKTMLICHNFSGSVGWALATDSSGHLFFTAYYNTTDMYSISTDVLSAGVWNHIIVVIHNDIASLYINNSEASYSEQTAGVGGAKDDSALQLKIGYNALGDFYDGRIDDLRFYDSILNSENRSFLYNSGSGTEEEIDPAPDETVTVPTETTTNRMQIGLNRLMARFKAYNGIPISYYRGSSVIEDIISTVGRTPYDIIDGDAMISVESRDYFIEKTDLVYSETQWYPQSGDRIVTEDGNVYEVSCPRGDNVYENMGPEGTVFKIHTVGKRA